METVGNDLPGRAAERFGGLPRGRVMHQVQRPLAFPERDHGVGRAVVLVEAALRGRVGDQPLQPMSAVLQQRRVVQQFPGRRADAPAGHGDVGVVGAHVAADDRLARQPQAPQHRLAELIPSSARWSTSICASRPPQKSAQLKSGGAIFSNGSSSSQGQTPQVGLRGRASCRLITLAMICPARRTSSGSPALEQPVGIIQRIQGAMDPSARGHRGVVTGAGEAAAEHLHLFAIIPLAAVEERRERAGSNAAAWTTRGVATLIASNSRATRVTGRAFTIG